MSPTPEPDLGRVVEVLDRHGVEYLIVGGHAARAYGATRLTSDSDCLVRQDKDNLARLDAALRELSARLRVGGLSDEESATLPVHIDAILNQGGFSNWRTDAGDLDVMTEMRDRTGTRRRYEDFTGDAQWLDFAGITVRVAGLDDIIASKEFANRPKDREVLPELRALANRSRSIEPARPSPPLLPPIGGPGLCPPGPRP